MKRFLSVLLMTLILAQTLPLHALAAAGHVLTDDELAAAYALTGFGADGNSSNAASVHRGMTPNDNWNAMQVSDWLDDKLDEDMFNLEDVLTKVSNTIILLKETDPEAYERFTGKAGSHREYAEYVERAKAVSGGRGPATDAALSAGPHRGAGGAHRGAGPAAAGVRRGHVRFRARAPVREGGGCGKRAEGLPKRNR